MDLSVENLCGLLKRSRLVTYEQVHSLYDRWVIEAKDKATSSTLFTKWLVDEKIVTEYQATLLAKGMVDDFFLGDYKILERVGRGRMAGVYKAQHADGRIVAIKVLPPSRSKIPALMARFQREAELALTFDHPNVVRSIDVGEANGIKYIVMELLDGETVDEVLLRRKRLPPAEAVDVVHQALRGLQHLHEHGVVHRDLKPSNLMLVPGVKPGEPDTVRGRTVKILDIGLARKMLDEADVAEEKVEPSEVTRDGVLLGTPDYLSPEQARDPRAIDIRADIYSLGCVLHHLIAGQPPFPDSNLLNLMLRHAGEQAKPLKEFVPEVPEGLQQILNYMTAKQPELRYPTPARAADALQAFLLADAAQPTGATTVDAPPPPETERRGKKRKGYRVPTAKSLTNSPKFAAYARKAPVSQPHLAPKKLPPTIELVPLEPTAPPASVPPADSLLAGPSPFATETYAPPPTAPSVLQKRRRPQGRNKALVAILASVVALVGAIIAVLVVLFK